MVSITGRGDGAREARTWPGGRFACCIVCDLCNDPNFFKTGHSVGRIFCCDVANLQQGAPMLRSQTENFPSGIASGNPSTLGQQAAGEQSSASINLLCEFLTNPFGNVEQARELLSQNRVMFAAGGF